MKTTTKANKTAKGVMAAGEWDLVWSELCAARRSGDAELVQAAEHSVRLYNARYGFPELSGLTGSAA